MDISEWTPIKNHIVNGLMGMLMRASRSSMLRFPQSYPTYHYIDMNAADGSGGSEFFLSIAHAIGMPYQALLIERDKRRYADLEARYAQWQCVYTHHGDHCQAAPTYCHRYLQGKPYGLVYNDNCGIPSWDTLASIGRLPSAEHIDFIINCPATAIKRVRRVFKRDEFLIDSLNTIAKKYWMVRYPEGRWQWTVLMGTNWASKEWRAQRMYDINSPEGQEALDILNRTRGERDADIEQGTLPLV